MSGTIVTRPPAGSSIRQLITQEITADATIVSSHQIILSHTPISGTDEIWMNGIALLNGSGLDYTISTNVVTFNNAWVLTVGDIFLVKYTI